MCEYIRDNTKEALSRINQWVITGLFDAAGCGPFGKYIGRGKVRRYPPMARYWCAAFCRMYDHGFSSREVCGVLPPVLSREQDEPGFIERVAAEGQPVWLSYSLTNPGEHWTISDERPTIPRHWRSLVRSVDLAWLFAPGHE